MQTNRNARSRHVQSVQATNAYSKSTQKDSPLRLILLAALCLLLPPLGIALVWRVRRMGAPIRIGLSGLGALSCVLLFWLLLRPTAVVSSILPTPQTPSQVGYGSVAAGQTVAVVPESTAIPSQPDVVTIVSTADPNAVPQGPDELTDDSIVYAVTNNATSYHLYEICDQQENHRALTLREALNEGLAPCEKCVGAVG